MTKVTNPARIRRIINHACVGSGERNNLYISIYTGLPRIRRSLKVNCCKQERCLAPYQGIKALHGDDNIVPFASHEAELMAA